MIRVFPNAPARPWPEAVASAGALLVWAGLRSLWTQQGAPGGLPVVLVLHVVLLATLGWLGFRTLGAVRRGQEVLEVYVGKRFLELVTSRGGHEVRRETLELVRLEDATATPRSVCLAVEGGPHLRLPMAMHSDEARGWMVEHLRGAGLGARRRYGHLPLAGSALHAVEAVGSSSDEDPTPAGST